LYIAAFADSSYDVGCDVVTFNWCDYIVAEVSVSVYRESSTEEVPERDQADRPAGAEDGDGRDRRWQAGCRLPAAGLEVEEEEPEKPMIPVLGVGADFTRVTDTRPDRTEFTVELKPGEVIEVEGTD
jgi:hypothetical protein